MSWFEKFLNDTADEWFAEAERCSEQATEALRLGDVMVSVRAQGEATAYRRMARMYRRQGEQVAA